MRKSSDHLNWDDLKYFAALADTNRMSSAAKRLGVNYATVSRRIDRLEDRLKVKLFQRSNDGYFLTKNGETLKTNLSSVSEALEKMCTPAQHAGELRQPVRLSVVHSMAQSLVVDCLAKLQTQHPTLDLELDTSTRNVNIAKKESDIALRLALPDSGEYLSRRLANLDYVLCGTEQLRKKYLSGKSVATISYDQDLMHLPEAEYIYSHFGVDSIALRSNSATLQLSAAAKGIGLAVVPYYLYVDSGLQIMDMVEPVQREIWLLSRKSTSQQDGVRKVIDALAEYFKNNDHLLCQPDS